jgi:membrane-bound lytic murein transglycosylase MltF
VPRRVMVALVSAIWAACSIAALLSCRPKPAEEKSTTATAAQSVPAPAGLEIEESTSYALKLPSKFAPYTGDWEAIREHGVLRMLVIYSKTSFFYDKGRPRGLNAELAQELQLYLNKKLKTGAKKFEVALIPVTTAQLLQSLNDGVGDIIAAAVFVTPEREKLVDFTMPIITESKLIVVTNKNAPPVAKLEDLSGREIVINEHSLSYMLLHEMNLKLRHAGKPEIKIVESDPNLLEEDLLEMTNAGLIAATTAYDKRVELWASVLPI